MSEYTKAFPKHKKEDGEVYIVGFLTVIANDVGTVCLVAPTLEGLKLAWEERAAKPFDPRIVQKVRISEEASCESK